MAQFVNFADPADPEHASPIQEAETPEQSRSRIHKLRLEKWAAKAAEELEKYNPTKDPNVSGDPYKTLFVASLGLPETYWQLRRCSGTAIARLTVAYKQADGRKLDGRRVLVDVERGRTVPNWHPCRLGGGLGTTRVGGEEVDQRFSGRQLPQLQMNDL